MPFWEHVILTCVLMINLAPCGTTAVQQQQQQNRTLNLRNTEPAAGVSVTTCGPPDTGVRGEHAQAWRRGFPGGRSPLDPLSIRSVRLGRNRNDGMSQAIGSQRRGSIDQSLDGHTDGQQTSVTRHKSRETESKDRTPNSSYEKSPANISSTGGTHRVRTKTSVQSIRRGFGLPMDRIGLGRLPGGRS